MLAQRVELALACDLGILHDLPIIVLPGAIFSIRTAGVQRDLLAPPGKVLVAIEPEAFSVPDIADGSVLTLPMLVLAEMS